MGTVYIPRLLLVGGWSEMNKAPGLHVLLKVRIDKTAPMLRTAVVSCTQATVAFFNTCTRWVRIPVAKASCRAHRLYINNYVRRPEPGSGVICKSYAAWLQWRPELVRSRSRYRRYSSYVKYHVITKRRSKGRSHDTSGPSFPTVELVHTCCWQPKCPHALTAPGCRRLLRKRAGLRSGSVPSRTSVVRLAGFGRTLDAGTLRKGCVGVGPAGQARGRKPLSGLKPASSGCLFSGRSADRFSRSRIRKHPRGKVFEHFQGCVTFPHPGISLMVGSAEWVGVKTAFRETCSVPGRNGRFWTKAGWSESSAPKYCSISVRLYSIPWSFIQDAWQCTSPRLTQGACCVHRNGYSGGTSGSVVLNLSNAVFLNHKILFIATS